MKNVLNDMNRSDSMSSEQKDINRHVQEQRDGGDRRSVSPSSSTGSFDPARPEHSTGISGHPVGDSLPPLMQRAREISQGVLRHGTESSPFTGMAVFLEGSVDPRLHEDLSARRARLERSQADAQSPSNQAEASSSQPRKHGMTDLSDQERHSKKAREDLSSDEYQYVGRIGTLEQVQNITLNDITSNLPPDDDTKHQLTDLAKMLKKRARGRNRNRTINNEDFTSQWDMKATNADGDLELAMRNVIANTNARLAPTINFDE